MSSAMVRAPVLMSCTPMMIHLVWTLMVSCCASDVRGIHRARSRAAAPWGAGRPIWIVQIPGSPVPIVGSFVGVLPPPVPMHRRVLRAWALTGHPFELPYCLTVPRSGCVCFCRRSEGGIVAAKMRKMKCGGRIPGRASGLPVVHHAPQLALTALRAMVDVEPYGSSDLGGDPSDDEPPSLTSVSHSEDDDPEDPENPSGKKKRKKRKTKRHESK